MFTYLHPFKIMAIFRQYIAPFLIVLVFLFALLTVSARAFLPADMAAPAPIEEVNQPQQVSPPNNTPAAIDSVK